MIEFLRPYGLKESMTYVEECLTSGHLSGDGIYTKHCSSWLKSHLKAREVLMTTSCTHALELAMHLLDLGPDDEVILPSYTYPSTANAVMMAGAKVVFSQVREEDLTLDTNCLEEKITPNTRAIIPVHYGGVVCQMSPITALAKKHGLVVVEDAAQGFLSTYNGQKAGTFGAMGCLSFHGTKDVIAGEGGALVMNDPKYLDRACILREKGTNRPDYLKGLVPKYEWVDKGSSYSPSELLMAVLLGQLEQAEMMRRMRLSIYERYMKFFKEKNFKCLQAYSQQIEGVDGNGHIFWVIFREVQIAIDFIEHMNAHSIQVLTHFVPLHESHYGARMVEKKDSFILERALGQRLVRLPIYPDLGSEEQQMILEACSDFMEKQP